MLAYILHSKWHWSVKFWQPVSSDISQSLLPRPWLEDLLVVCPSESIQCIVDLDFRSKFIVRGTSQCSKTVSTLPTVYIGCLEQLVRDLNRWTALLAEDFAQKSHTLPPWRCKDTFTRMYEACIKCDMTASYLCLRNLNLQLAHRCGTAVHAPLGPGCVEEHYLDPLLAILGPDERVDPTLEDLSAPSCLEEEAYFEKDFGHTPVPDRSGLSFLIEEAQAPGGGLQDSFSFRDPLLKDLLGNW
jgi:hypothetical protein